MGCTTAGDLTAGANCTKFVSGQQTQLNFEEWIEFLEPRELPNGKKKAPAVCMPMDDFIDQKQLLEEACVHLKCTKKVKKKIDTIIKNAEGLIDVNRDSKSND